MPRVGYLAAVSATADAPRLEAFRKGLQELGYVEGRNIHVEYRHESRDFGRLPLLAAELQRLDIDVLVAVTTNAAVAAKKTVGSLPIVFMGVTDPIAAGLAQSSARPGGNSTGITNMAASLAGKRLEILKETLPALDRVAVLWDPQAPGSIPQWNESQAPARELKLALNSMPVSRVDQYVGAFKDAAKARSKAVWITLNPLANSNQALIADGPAYSVEGARRRALCRPDPEGRATGRHPDRAAEQVRTRDQPEDRQANRGDGPAVRASARRPDDRVRPGFGTP